MSTIRLVYVLFLKQNTDWECVVLLSAPIIMSTITSCACRHSLHALVSRVSTGITCPEPVPHPSRSTLLFICFVTYINLLLAVYVIFNVFSFTFDCLVNSFNCKKLVYSGLFFICSLSTYITISLKELYLIISTYSKQTSPTRSIVFN